jgi:hypothetical protein
LEQELNADFLDRSKIAFLIDDKVELIPLPEIKAAVKAGKIDAKTRFFNNTLQNLGDWRNGWMQALEDSWLKRYLN